MATGIDLYCFFPLQIDRKNSRKLEWTRSQEILPKDYIIALILADESFNGRFCLPKSRKNIQWGTEMISIFILWIHLSKVNSTVFPSIISQVKNFSQIFVN